MGLFSAHGPFCIDVIVPALDNRYVEIPEGPWTSTALFIDPIDFLDDAKGDQGTSK